MKNNKKLLLIFLFLFTSCSSAAKAEQGSSPTAPAPTPIMQASKTPLTTALFTHPRQIYSLSYPIDWQQEITAHEQGYADAAFTSPGYRISEGYPILEEGAEFLVLVKKLSGDFATAEEYFTENPLVNTIARNTIGLEVAGTPAIQFDYSYEGVEAIMTIFVIQGNLFQIRYRYINSEAKPEFLKEYQALLNSLVVNDSLLD